MGRNCTLYAYLPLVTYPTLVSPHFINKEHIMIETISNILHNFLILGITITIWTIGIFFGVLTIFEIWRKFNGKYNE
tara:strand:- start:709 stop:939 length:231 start_codon:yes stop_codon:yes gene_type:complete